MITVHCSSFKAKLFQVSNFFHGPISFPEIVLLIKKMEIEKPKPTFVLSTFQTEITNLGLVFKIPTKVFRKRNRFIEKITLFEIT